MSSAPARLLDTLAPASFAGLRGIEREALRVTPRGCLARTPHPPALGSALTHPYITTDYSEALLEFVTPAERSIGSVLDFLSDIHAFTLQNLEGELLWPASMPCILGDDDSIPIARYGSSNIGLMKHIYRRGLGHRYGRKMQTIAGVHYNFSLSDEAWRVLHQANGGERESPADFRNRLYFAMLRNFQRVAWLVPLLFGASPAVCRSFLGGRTAGFQAFDRHTYYAPYATSLRMSDIGYKNKSQSGLAISYNDLDSYVAGLVRAICTEDPEYAAIGTRVEGEWRQLSTSVLQIENEYYSFIRPKQPINSGERPTVALKKRGVRYLEIRALDNDPLEPHGVNPDALRFMDLLLLHALAQDSPPISETEREAIEHNQALVARQGRDPALRLRRNGETIALRDWAQSILEELAPLAEWLDRGDPGHGETLERQRRKLEDYALMPAAQMLDGMRARRESFFDYAHRLAQAHAETLRARRVPPERLRHFRESAQASLEEQRALEASDRMDFESFLAAYYAQPC